MNYIRAYLRVYFSKLFPKSQGKRGDVYRPAADSTRCIAIQIPPPKTVGRAAASSVHFTLFVSR